MSRAGSRAGEVTAPERAAFYLTLREITDLELRDLLREIEGYHRGRGKEKLDYYWLRLNLGKARALAADLCRVEMQHQIAREREQAQQAQV